MLLVSIWEKIGHVVTAINCSTIIFTNTLPLLIIHDFGFPHNVDDSSYYPQACMQWRPKQTSAGKLCIEYTSANNMKRWENIDMSIDGPGACFTMFMNYLYHLTFSIKYIFSFHTRPYDHHKFLHMLHQYSRHVMCKVLWQSSYQNLYKCKMKFPSTHGWKFVKSAPDVGCRDRPLAYIWYELSRKTKAIAGLLVPLSLTWININPRMDK